MNRASNIEASNAAQTPVQNFPDYVRYVMMKSMAGFGKVHNELSRLYSNVSDKPSRSSQQIVTPAASTGLRKRLSMRESRWSSTGSLKPQKGSETFTSYILEDNESESENDSGKKTSVDDSRTSTSGTDTNGETHSAPPTGVRKKMFTFEEQSESMPHSELLSEAIYVNDRVLLIEQQNVDNSNDFEPEHSHSIPNCGSSDDYINLQTAYDIEKSDEYVAMDQGSLPPLKQVVKDTNKCGIAQRSMLMPQSQFQQGDADSTNQQENRNSLESDDEHDYSHPSSWIPDYNNVPHKITEKELRESSEEYKQSEIKEVTNSNNISRGNVSKEAIHFKVKEVIKHVDTSKEESDYDVPVPGTRPINRPKESTKDYDIPRVLRPDNTNRSPENDYDVPKPHSPENDYDVPKPHSPENDYDVPKPYSPENDYDIPKPHRKLSDNDSAIIDAVNAPNYTTKSSTERNANISKDTPSNKPRDISQRFTQQSNHKTVSHSASVSRASRGGEERLNSVVTPDTSESTKSGKHFSEFTVDEVVDCLNKCSLMKLAKLCGDEQMDGAYLCNLTEAELIKEPFAMNWFHISKLFKVIKGWRPKRL